MNFDRTSHRIPWWLIGPIAAVASVGTGCAEPGPGDSPETGVFVSDNPSRAVNGGVDDYGDDGEAAEGDSGTNGAGGGDGGEEPPAAAPEDPERLIVEADIVQVSGDRLYALSQYSGLAIIDMSNPDKPELLGRKSLGGVPFEMYLDGESVYAMMTDFGHYEEVDGGWQWATASHVAILDASDPTHVGTVASFDVPGQIADSRMVGDILYLVTFESGYCWECKESPNTTISSFDVRDPKSPSKVDQLVVEDPGAEYGWRRSISVTENRIFIGGVEWDNDTYDSSDIQVVDISDAEGDLQLGANVRVAGQILSRWQMDEHEGVLRVISQPWNTSVYPRVETFAIATSKDIEPLGSVEIITPIPESLRAVRFDETRAFAITAEQVDPLFTIDLSDPALPKVVGELEIPGWVFHIEPRGDRLLALGFDNANEGGSLNVSLFDVSNLEQPTLVRRVAFGGDWGNFAEDQDRIHKAFKILPELGLLLVPFTAWNWDDYGCSGYESGVQLVDWNNDDLVRRGVAPIRGEARRAFVYENRLFALSDEQLRGFDISDRDEPSKTAELALSSHVSQVTVAGEHIVRLSADWWTSEPRLEIVSANDPARIDAIGSVDLGSMLADVEQDEACYGWSYWSVRVFAHGSNVALVWPSWNGQTARLVMVDISDPTKPRIGKHIDLPMDAYNYGSWYYGDVVSAGDTVAQVGSTLAFEEVVYELDDDGYYGNVKGARVRFVDISDADAPAPLLPIDLPDGMGYTGLVAQGSRLLLSHWEEEADDGDKVRFYLDRIDLSYPFFPILKNKINVPGSLVSYDSDSGHLLTTDYVRTRLHATTSQVCYSLGYNASFEVMNEGDASVWGDETGVCDVLRKQLKLVSVDEEGNTARHIETVGMPAGWLTNLVVGDDRVFFASNYYYYDEENGEHYENNLYVVGGMSEGKLVMAKKSLDEAWWTSPIAADGKTLLSMSWPGAMTKLDATDLGELEIEKIGEMPWWVMNVKVHDGKALLSLGPYGLDVIDLH